jgi:CDK inhibitor PHO81
LSDRKFGKQIQKRQLEIPEYAASFVDYKALKKVRASYNHSAISPFFNCAITKSIVVAHQSTERNACVVGSK